MNQIEVMVLNASAIKDAEKLMVAAARLTQKGEKVKNAKDFRELYKKPYTENTVRGMCSLPHPTIQKFGAINVVIVGASRRFLAQITRHQNEVKFMSASLQYSDYSGEADFVVPYELLGEPYPVKRAAYLATCEASMKQYETLTAMCISNDSAGYMAPQGLRNVLIMSATPYQWKHMIAQRVCQRNTTETRYVMLKIWEQLQAINPEMFAPGFGPFCMQGACKEGSFNCGKPIEKRLTAAELLKLDFPKIYEEEEENE